MIPKLEKIVDPYASGVLLPDVHGRLVANLGFYAADAGVSVDKLWTSLHTLKPPQEVFDYLKAFRRQTMNGVNGLVFHGENPDCDVLDLMGLMAAVLVRNFTRARLMPVSELLDYIEEHGQPQHTCLLIPDFHVGAATNAVASKHRISRLVEVLVSRQQSGLQTILYAPSLNGLKLEYGAMIARHLQARYQFVPIG